MEGYTRKEGEKKKSLLACRAVSSLRLREEQKGKVIEVKGGWGRNQPSDYSVGKACREEIDEGTETERFFTQSYQ